MALFPKKLALLVLYDLATGPLCVSRLLNSFSTPLLCRCPRRTQWPWNVQWWSPEDGEGRFTALVSAVQQFIRCQAAQAARLGKPLVVGEFGFQRDRGSLSPSAGTSFRDRRARAGWWLYHPFLRCLYQHQRPEAALVRRWQRCLKAGRKGPIDHAPLTTAVGAALESRYYGAVFDEVVAYARAGGSLAGANFWHARLLHKPAAAPAESFLVVLPCMLLSRRQRAASATQGLLWRLPRRVADAHQQERWPLQQRRFQLLLGTTCRRLPAHYAVCRPSITH